MDKEVNNSFDWDKVKKKATRLILEARAENQSESTEIKKPYEKKYIIEKEIDNYFSCIKNSDHPLSMLNGRMSDDDLANYICKLALDGSVGNKRLYNLGKKGMKNDCTLLYKEMKSFDDYNLPNRKEKLSTAFKDVMDKGENDYNPCNRIKKIYNLIQSYYNKNCNGLFLDLLDENDKIFRGLIIEKIVAERVGLSTVYYKRVFQYLTFLYIMFSELLFFVILSYGRFDVIKEWLHESIKRMDELKCDWHDKIEFRISKKRYQKIKINDNGDTVNPASDAWGLWNELKQIWDEEDQIEPVLEDDLKKNMCFFVRQTPFLHNNVSEYKSDRQMILDWTGKNHVSDIEYRKLREAKEFIKVWSKVDGFLGSDDDTALLYIIFREIFINKVRLPNKNENLEALTIARKILRNEKKKEKFGLTRYEKVFINKKIQRGHFCICGLQEEYLLYNTIMQKYRKVLLDIFRIPNDMECYEWAHSIGEQAIKIFYIE